MYLKLLRILKICRKREYEKLIDAVGTSYSNIETASRADLAAFKKEMKEHWLEIAKTAVPKKGTG
jgi:hypothetical protein